MFGLGFGEIILVLLIALIFIGPKKLPELAKGLGQGIREFQKAAKGFSDSLQETNEGSQKKTETPPEQIADATQQEPSETPVSPESKKEDHHS